MLLAQSALADDFDRNMQAIRDQSDRRGVEMQNQAIQQQNEARQQAELNQLRIQQQNLQDQVNDNMARQHLNGLNQ